MHGLCTDYCLINSQVWKIGGGGKESKNDQPSTMSLIQFFLAAKLNSVMNFTWRVPPMQWYSRGGGLQPLWPSWLAEHPLWCRGAAFPIALCLQGINRILAPVHDKKHSKFSIKVVTIRGYHPSLKYKFMTRRRPGNETITDCASQSLNKSSCLMSGISKI